jgi:hypothetical protein
MRIPKYPQDHSRIAACTYEANSPGIVSEAQEDKARVLVKSC